MQRKFYFKTALIIFCVICLSLLMVNSYLPKKQVDAFSSQVLSRGSTGQDVKELQERLIFIGFLDDKADGVFGWNTYWALRNFQKEFGMKVDGIAGTKLKEMLTKATKNYKGTTSNNTANNNNSNNNNSNNNNSNNNNSNNNKPNTNKPNNSNSKPNDKPIANAPNGYTDNDIKLIANAVYGESRGEPYIGQVAVAAVILNRLTNASFPNSISGVIYQPGAFTAVADGQINLTPNAQAKKAVIDAINGWDPTTGCIYYYNPKTATNQWIRGRPIIITIGQHIFCK
ncbi:MULTISPECIES: spore cortex-lytic enzyme [unclassified Bacillus (in: firmicutes)]|uniref:spore cortex-lytic enzyme n=1 Tax=unclassified Bacillus (in: firmicutes) TaxID=185979 RepID=UPI000BEFC011|nr:MULTISPECIES: spore cortex-lytic enzyme [unclassified Bacillus (in: firmicutes)]PEJ59138.1 spore cortex-lytic enzyme [Bacillus sp. AFS002410]PEL14355.1 spore cortex-lytic enzyme [Bacillus sp. AFS017336]